LKNSLRHCLITAGKIAVAGLLLLAAGCAAANSDNSSDNGKNGGLYGGASGGWSHP
jgi:hypothetical protein